MAAGCSTHYRQALERYRKAEPVPFYEKTQEWARSANAEETVAPGAVPETIGPSETAANPEDALLRITAEILGVPQDKVRDAFDRMHGKEPLGRDLAGRVDWETLRFAVAYYNPAVQAARARWQATLRQYSQADFLEGLLREYKTFTRYLKVETGKPLQQEMEQDFFPYPSTIAIKGELIREQVHLAELEWQLVLRDTLLDAGNVFFDYQYQHRAEAATLANVTLLENTASVVEKRYQSGVASQADLLKAQTELDRQRNMVRDFVAYQKADAAQIVALLDLPPHTPLGKPGDNDLHYEVPSLKLVVETALAHRQEVNAEKAKAARTEIAIRLGEIMNRPLFSQGYSASERGMMPEASVEASSPTFGLRAKTSVRPAYAQAEAYLAEMRERLRGERAGVSQVEAQTEGLARTVLDNIDIAHRALKLVEDIVLPQNRTVHEIATSAYTSGNMSFLDLLDAERGVIQANLELDQSRRNQNLALLRLAAVRGVFQSNDK
jgi:hypothetical protein